MKNWNKDIAMWGLIVFYLFIILLVINPSGMTGFAIGNGESGLSRGYAIWTSGFIVVLILIGIVGLKLKKLLSKDSE